MEQEPSFYCLVGPKADMSDIRRFAAQIGYKLPSFEFYCGFWSWNGRLLLFYDDSVLDAPISLSFIKDPDGSGAICFSDPNAEIKMVGE